MHTEALKGLEIVKCRSDVDVGGAKPDVWFEPKMVWEVLAADLSLSPIYSAAKGSVSFTIFCFYSRSLGLIPHFCLSIHRSTRAGSRYDSPGSYAFETIRTRTTLQTRNRSVSSSSARHFGSTTYGILRSFVPI